MSTGNSVSERGQKNKTPMVSVIIPVFNRERFIGKLLSSVSKQSLSDFEVICVDDGSTDSTYEVIAEFCKKDARFFCVRKENGGAGSARNAGLDMAKGKYVMFLDSDDQYHIDLLMEMVTTAEKHNADEVFCFCDEYNYKTHTSLKKIGFDSAYFPDDTPINTADVNNLYQRLVWGPTNILFLKDLIDRHKLRFSTTQITNDTFFLCAYVSLTERIVCIHKSLVTIRMYIDAQSLTATRWQHTEESVFVLEELYGWLRDNDLYDRYRDAFRMYFISAFRYNGSFPLNPKYVDAITEAICEKDLFRGLSEEEFYENYWKDLDTDRIKKRIREFSQVNTSGEFKVQKMSNLMLTVLCVEELAYEKYGRVLSHNNE